MRVAVDEVGVHPQRDIRGCIPRLPRDFWLACRLERDRAREEDVVLLVDVVVCVGLERVESIESPPTSAEQTSVKSLRPGRAAPGRRPRSSVSSTTCSIPSRAASVLANTRPALATTRPSSKAGTSRSSSPPPPLRRLAFVVTIWVTS